MADIPVEHRRYGYEPATYDVATTAPSLLKRISWGAIFAGTAVALGILILMGLLGSAIGIGAIDPGEEANPLAGLDTGAAIWWVISSLVALFVGGRVAGQLAGFPSRTTAMLHGLTVWALTTFVTAWIATSAVSSVVNTATSAVATAAQGIASAAGAVAPNAIPADAARAAAQDAKQEAVAVANEAGLEQREVDQAGAVLQETARDILTSPGDLGADLNNMMDQLFRGEGAVVSPQERDRLVAALAQRLGVSEAEAQRIADRWITETRQTADSLTNRVETTAGNAADALSAAAWAAFFTSLAALLAGIFGAASGAPKEPYLSVHHRVDDDGHVKRTAE